MKGIETLNTSAGENQDNSVANQWQEAMKDLDGESSVEQEDSNSEEQETNGLTPEVSESRAEMLELSDEEVAELIKDFSEGAYYYSDPRYAEQEKQEFLGQCSILLDGKTLSGQQSKSGPQNIREAAYVALSYDNPDGVFVKMLEDAAETARNCMDLQKSNVDPYKASLVLLSLRKYVSDEAQEKGITLESDNKPSGAAGELMQTSIIGENIFESYLRSFAVNDEELTTLTQRLPGRVAEKKQDPNYVTAIGRSGDSVVRGGWTTASFECACLAKSATASNICKLMEAYCELPGSDKNDFLNARVDAMAIERAELVGTRDFIHNEWPGAHDLTVAMLAYYDGMKKLEVGNLGEQERAQQEATLKAQLESVVEECRRIKPDGYAKGHFDGAEGQPFDSGPIFDIPRYDKLYTFTEFDLGRSSGATELSSNVGDRVPTVDILRRIERCTRQRFGEPPVSGIDFVPNCNGANSPENGPPLSIDMLAQRAFQDLTPYEDEDGKIQAKEEVDITSPSFRNYMTGINEYLMANQGKAVLTAESVALLSWTSDLAKKAIRSVGDQEVAQLPYDPAFKEVVRFNELTMGDGYSHEAFENFWEYFRTVPYVSGATDPRSPSNPALQARMDALQARELVKVRAQLESYNRDAITEDGLYTRGTEVLDEIEQTFGAGATSPSERNSAAKREQHRARFRPTTKGAFDRAKKMVNSGNLEHELEILRERVNA